MLFPPTCYSAGFSILNGQFNGFARIQFQFNRTGRNLACRKLPSQDNAMDWQDGRG